MSEDDTETPATIWKLEGNPNDGVSPKPKADPVDSPARRQTVYGLVDPRTEKVVYVGITVLKPERMLMAYQAYVKYMPNLPLSIWLDDLALEDLEPQLIIIEETYDRKRVVHWIQHYQSLSPLLNLSDNGYELDAAERLGYKEMRPEFKDRTPGPDTQVAENKAWEARMEANRSGLRPDPAPSLEELTP